MKKSAKNLQMQIRVSAAEKAAIQLAAKKANMDMSQWVLRQVLPLQGQVFQAILKKLQQRSDQSYVLAELNDFLNNLTANEFNRTLNEPPKSRLSDYLLNYIAAMVEYAATKKAINPPGWVNEINPLPRPIFGTELKSLHLYLLTHSPIPFRRRNIFIDASVGDRI